MRSGRASVRQAARATGRGLNHGRHDIPAIVPETVAPARNQRETGKKPALPKINRGNDVHIFKI